ncbi:MULTISPECIES: ECF transporter S component [Bacillaceae]|jgi:energy-coupling factor transport system substrate-specific component|uniref:ECF transporter S component n=1 Tax=Bacillaceae TaxID=186817 RepID=UPI000BF3E86A|nr:MULTISPECIES: ECF transporter S component [Bacillaceae]PFG03399.1 energy-coupling factor transport system substrate-specific component [Bacillus sp. es.034]WGG46443.1 ECF transporter S component [Rossellomorea sp. DA94]
MKSIKKDFTLISILLIPIGVAVNVVAGELVELLKIPLFLNQIGTMIVAMVAGPWVGAVTGGVSKLIFGIFNPTQLAFMPVAMASGIVVGLMAKKGLTKNVWKVAFTGFIVAIVAILIATPTTVIVFGGASGTGSDTITAVLLASGKEIWTSVFTQKIFVESIDKILSILVAYMIVRKMSDQYLSKQKYGHLYLTMNNNNRSTKIGA